MIWRNKEAAIAFENPFNYKSMLDIELWDDDSTATPAVNRIQAGQSKNPWNFNDQKPVKEDVPEEQTTLFNNSGAVGPYSFADYFKNIDDEPEKPKKRRCHQQL